MCRRDTLGSCLSFHKINNLGYSTDIDAAKLLLLEEAQEAWNNGREFDHPISASMVRKHSIYRVDFQKLPIKSTKGPSGCSYMAFIKGVTDGNDVYWLNNTSGQSSVDFNKGSKMSYEQVVKLGESYVYVPFDLANQARRRTFNIGSLDFKKMVLDFGLIKPDHANSY